MHVIIRIPLGAHSFHRALVCHPFFRSSTAGSRSKNSATNQKRAYGVGTELVCTGYARIQPGILMGCTHIVRSGYGLQGGGVTILVQIDVELIFRGVFL